MASACGTSAPAALRRDGRRLYRHRSRTACWWDLCGSTYASIARVLSMLPSAIKTLHCVPENSRRACRRAARGPTVGRGETATGALTLAWSATGALMVLAALALWQQQVATVQRDRAQVTQVNVLVGMSTQQHEQANFVPPALLALQALPDADNDVPYVARAEAALYRVSTIAWRPTYSRVPCRPCPTCS